MAQPSHIRCFDNVLQFMNVFSRPRPGKSPRRSLQPSVFAAYPSDRFEIRIGSGRLIRNMRWTRTRSYALASNHGPANQRSGRPERARARAGGPHEEHGALLRPIGRADGCSPNRRSCAVGAESAAPGEHESTFMLPRHSLRSRSIHGSNASDAAVTDSALDWPGTGDELTRCPQTRCSVRTAQTQRCRGNRAVSEIFYRADRPGRNVLAIVASQH